jgi:hypothetical protein
VKTIIVNETNFKWLQTIPFYRKDDITDPADIYGLPKIRAEVLSKFVNQIGFEIGDKLGWCPPTKNSILATRLDSILSVLSPKHPFFVSDSRIWRVDNYYQTQLGIGACALNLFAEHGNDAAIQKGYIERLQLGEKWKDFWEEIDPFMQFLHTRLEAARGIAGWWETVIAVVKEWGELEKKRLIERYSNRNRPIPHCSKCSLEMCLQTQRFGICWKCLICKCRAPYFYKHLKSGDLLQIGRGGCPFLIRGKSKE